MHYEYLRDLVINHMAEAGHRPSDMQKVVTAILEA
jgi:hypothetical protein